MKLSDTIFAVVLIGLAGLVIWLGPKPHPRSPKLVVRFVGLTNDASGAQLAAFDLSNAGNTPLRAVLPGSVEVNDPRYGGGGSWFTNGPLLRPSSPPMRVTVTPPKTQYAWRARFFHTPPLTLSQRLRKFAASWGAPLIPVGQVAYPAYSEWLYPTVEFDWMPWPKLLPLTEPEFQLR